MKLLRVLFKEIHKVRVEAAGLENIRDDVARVNGSFLYAALEELRVLPTGVSWARVPPASQVSS
jgi:hypothetical protein